LDNSNFETPQESRELIMQFIEKELNSRNGVVNYVIKKPDNQMVAKEPAME